MSQPIVKKQLLKIFGILSLTCFVFYANIIRNVYSEDDYRVTSDYRRHNTAVEKGFAGLGEIFTSRYTQTKVEDLEVSYGYRPMARATFAIEWQLWGQNPHLGHLVNILLYCLTTCMLFYLLSKTVFRNKDTIYPLLTTLLFIAHPIHTEVVASLKNREEQLCFFFGMLYIATIWRYFTTRQLWLPWLGVGLFILAILSKETGVMYMPLAAVFVFFFHPQAAVPLSAKERINFIAILAVGAITYVAVRTLDPLVGMAAAFAAIIWFNKRKYAALVTYVLAILLIMLNTVFLPDVMLGGSNAGKYVWANPLYGNAITLSERLGFMLNALFYNIKLLFIPHPLSFYYGYNVVPVTGIFAPKALFALAIMLGLIYYGYKQYNKNRIIPFAVAFFIVAIAPVSNLMPVPGIVADRFLYVPSLAFCIGLALVLINLKTTLGSKNYTAVYIVAAFIGVLYLSKVFTRNQDWYSYYDLYAKDAKNFPNSAKANSMFATLLIDNVPTEKDPRKRSDMIRLAVRHYEQSLKAYPTYAESLNALGFIYFQSGQFGKALNYHRQNLKANPDYTPVYVNVASCYHRLGDIPMAKKYYGIALKKDSLSPVVYLNFADIYISENKKDSAMYLYNLAKKRKINDAELDTERRKLELKND